MLNRREFVQLAAAASVLGREALYASPASGTGAGQSSGASVALPTDPAFLKAMKAQQDGIPLAKADPERPVYHFGPPSYWTNDPNGPFFYKGWNHLFYQLNPYEPRIGHQHWGHARSRDLVNWEHLPIAIWPSENLGERAIFSGAAAFAADGRPRIFYTSIGNAREPEQWLVIPKDDEMLVWEKYSANPVLSQAIHKSGPIQQWRDPYLFRKDNVTYMVCGGASAKGRAQVQLYRANDGELTKWTHLGPIYQSLDRDLRNFECPNLFPLDGKWVLMVSPNKPCEYWVGDLDIAAMKFEPTSHGILDPGDAYASNVAVDGQGRTILWFWGRTEPNAMPMAQPAGAPAKGWSSLITMPRVLSIGADGFLQQRPVPEFESLRQPVATFPAQSLDKATVIDGVATDCAEIEAVFSGRGNYGLELRRSDDGKPGITVSIQSSFFGASLVVGDVHAFLASADRYTLRIFLDKRCIEVFANDGEAAVYKWFNAPLNAQKIAVYGEALKFPGGAPPRAFANMTITPPRLESLKVWQMKPATFSLEHFHV